MPTVGLPSVRVCWAIDLDLQSVACLGFVGSPKLTNRIWTYLLKYCPEVGVNEKFSRLCVWFVTQTLSDGEWRRKWKLRVRRIRCNQNKPYFPLSCLLWNFRVFGGSKNHTFSTLRSPSTHQKNIFSPKLFKFDPHMYELWFKLSLASRECLSDERHGKMFIDPPLRTVFQ